MDARKGCLPPSFLCFGKTWNNGQECTILEQFADHLTSFDPLLCSTELAWHATVGHVGHVLLQDLCVIVLNTFDSQ